MLPVVLDLTGRAVVVIGAGRIGARKAAQLVAEGAAVTVIAREVLAELPSGLAAVHVREYRPGDLEGAWLAVVATGRPDVDDAVAAEGRERRVWVNVADVTAKCDYFFTANHRDGAVVVAVSTEGAAPALAQWVRDRVASTLPAGLGDVASALAAERRALHERGETSEGRDWRARIDELVRRAP